MKSAFNVIIIVGLTLAAVFLYGSFKNYESKKVEKDSNKESEEMVSGVEKIEGWETYQNSEYGFVLQHPRDWESQEALKPRNARAFAEIDIHAKEYEMVRPYVTIDIFDNSGKDSVDVWWEKWLGEEDQKKADCVAEYGENNAPCLYLRDLVRGEKDSSFGGVSVKTVNLFQFDSTKECNYMTKGDYVYGVCYDGENPNDPNFEANKEIVDKIFESFTLSSSEGMITNQDSGQDLGFEQYVPGKWQSTDDSKNVLFFKDGGVVENYYDNELVTSGNWVIDGYKIKTNVEGEEYVYTVLFAGSERLELSFLPKGNTLKYTRIK